MLNDLMHQSLRDIKKGRDGQLATVWKAALEGVLRGGGGASSRPGDVTLGGHMSLGYADLPAVLGCSPILLLSFVFKMLQASERIMHALPPTPDTPTLEGSQNCYIFLLLFSFDFLCVVTAR